MARITVEDCVDKFPSRFELVLVASQRARKLHAGEEPTVERDNDKNTVIALREIADSTISVNDMKENLIEEYQTITINDEENENLELESLNEDNNDDDNKKNDENEKSEILESQIDQEIKELSLAEENEIKENYQINEGINNDNSDSIDNESNLEEIETSEEIPSSENDEQNIST